MNSKLCLQNFINIAIFWKHNNIVDWKEEYAEKEEIMQNSSKSVCAHILYSAVVRHHEGNKKYVITVIQPSTEFNHRI